MNRSWSQTLVITVLVSILSIGFTLSQSLADKLDDNVINREEIGKMLTLKNPDSLSNYYKNLYLPNIVYRVVYWTRLATLSPTARNLGELISCVPQDRIENEILSLLSDNVLGDSTLDAQAGRIFDYECLKLCATAVRTDRRHYPRLFRYVLSCDGSVAMNANGVITELANNDIENFFRRLDEEHEKLEASILGAIEYVPKRKDLEPIRNKIPRRFWVFLHLR